MQSWRLNFEFSSTQRRRPARRWSGERRWQLLGCVQRCPRRWVQTPLLGVSEGERRALVITLSLSRYLYFYLYAYSACALSHPFSPFVCLSIFIAPTPPSTYFLASLRTSVSLPYLPPFLDLCVSSLPPSLLLSISAHQDWICAALIHVQKSRSSAPCEAENSLNY
jgi:hypothetical protein